MVAGVKHVRQCSEGRHGRWQLPAHLIGTERQPTAKQGEVAVEALEEESEAEGESGGPKA